MFTLEQTMNAQVEGVEV